MTDVVPSFQLAAAPGTPALFSKQVARLPPVSSIVPRAARIKYAKYSWQRCRQLMDVTSPCIIREERGEGCLKSGHFPSL